MFVDKAGSLPYSSLLRKSVNYGEKKFYNMVPRKGDLGKEMFIVTIGQVQVIRGPIL
jgi:hypothetical protein